RRAEELYHATLEREPAERARFLENACGLDLELRREVESLLAHCEVRDAFVDRPVWEITDAIPAAPNSEIVPRLAAGELLGPYKITAPIASGGMGEVYRARDTRLGRDVAVKILPAMYSRDLDRLRRFELEARTASALNHPNILVIYDVG